MLRVCLRNGLLFIACGQDLIRHGYRRATFPKGEGVGPKERRMRFPIYRSSQRKFMNEGTCFSQSASQ